MSKQPVETSLGDKFCPSLLIWGRPGDGKTTFAGSYTKGPIHFYEFDPQGTAVLRDHNNAHGITADTFTDAVHGPGKTYPAFWKQLQQDEKDGFFQDMLAKEGLVVFDSYTTLENYVVEYVAKTVLNKTQQTGGAYDIKRQDWPTVSSYVLAFFKAISKLPCAVAVLCHEKSIQNGDNEVFWRPTILGQQADAAPRWFMEYAHVSLGQNVGLKVRVKASPSTPASNRIFSNQKKLNVLLNPTMDTYYKAFHGQQIDCKTE